MSGIFLLSLPVIGCDAAGGVLTGSIIGALEGAGIGALLDVSTVSLSYALDKERKERKEREKFEALENLANIAKQKIRLKKKPHGFRVLVTTEKCAIKSIKKKKEKG